ncbi:tctex1 domain-containing protein 1-A-like [Actinia tenebrosa]|uniref:Tctex1 domain-containing protein 1-A-like n=1 Tax=Actinia tenebrosa TaxID=6105 RepID=A0A6P8H559_ACTTE|nr:tctex1 domain-containing protein 1-A-like [Actinia tenebrosa]
MERLIPNSQFKSDEILLEEKQFGVNLVQSVCKDILDENLYDLKYNAARCKVLATELSERMRNEVRAITASKYKVISTVSIGSLQSQLNVESRCLWLPQSDSFTSVSFKNSSIFAIATIFWISID